MSFLQVDHVVKNYGHQRALDGVTFHVQEGECFGLLGPNGAGKTTLLSILSCYHDADSGSARLLGQDLAMTNQAIRPAIGIAPQEIAVYGALTARENLLFFGRLYGIDEKILNDRVDRLLEAVGLYPKADVRVETFSGGMQRRMNLAAALVHQPRLLLLDEPTAGVDPQSRNHLFEEIRRCNQAGTTILYTTHYMEEVEALCTKVAIMDHGRIVADDSLQNLLNRMPSRVSLKLEMPAPILVEKLERIEGVAVKQEQAGSLLSIESHRSQELLLQTVRLLSELGLQPIHIQAEAPNLERVFLHLTGRALRD